LSEAKKKFRKLLNEYQDSALDDMFIEKKINAQYHYLRALDNESIDFAEYISATLNIPITVEDENYVDAFHEKIVDVLKKHGCKYDKQEIFEYLYYNEIPDEEKFAKELSSELSILLDKLTYIIGHEFRSHVGIEIITADVPYNYFLKIDGDKYAFVVNNRKTANKFNKSSLQISLIHEICAHAAQLDSWKMNIRQNKISEVYGCIEDNNPEIFCLEGLAEALPYLFFHNEMNELTYLELLLDEYHHLIQNQSYVKLMNGMSFNNVVEYYKYHYKLADEKDIRDRLNKFQTDPYYTSNLYVYYPSLRFFKGKINQADNENLASMFKELYFAPKTYEQYLKI